MNIAKKNLKGFSYFGAFVIVFIVILFVVMMLWPSGNEENSYKIRELVITDREQAREEMEK